MFGNIICLLFASKACSILIMGFIYFLLDGVKPRNYLRRLPRIDVLQANLTNFNSLYSEFGYHLMPNSSVNSMRNKESVVQDSL